jgi:hypothetical protein
MYRKIIGFTLLFVVVAWASADELQLKGDHPGRYVVERGDTLWDISGRFLAQPWRWPELWETNPQVADPHLIYPGDVLSLEWRDGRPYLTNGRYPGDRRIKLSPQMRSHEHDDAIDPIPLDAIRQFLSRPRVAGAGELEGAGYIAAGEEEHIVSGAGSRVYVRGLTGAVPGQRYTILRGGTIYEDPDTGEVLGHEALYVGDAAIVKGGEPATAVILTSRREVLNGDRLLPQVEEEYPRLVPHAGGVNGRIISVIDGFAEIGQHQIVVLNRGANDGLELGHVLGIFRTGSIVSDRHANKSPYIRVGKGGAESDSRPELVQLPDESTGELIVFRVFDRISYGLVMSIVRPAHINDRVDAPE